MRSYRDRDMRYKESLGLGKGIRSVEAETGGRETMGESVCVSEWGGTENLQADSLLNREPNMGLDHTTLRSRPEPKPRVRCSTD